MAHRSPREISGIWGRVYQIYLYLN